VNILVANDGKGPNEFMPLHSIHRLLLFFTKDLISVTNEPMSTKLN